MEDIIETNLLGAHQRENAGLAYRCLRSLGLDEGKIRHGLQQIEHAGRCQRLRPNLLVDGAHNRE